jgi:hypothetical protein
MALKVRLKIKFRQAALQHYSNFLYITNSWARSQNDKKRLLA